MATSTNRLAGTRIVVDTGALMTALLLNFVRMIKAPTQKRQEILDKGITPSFRKNRGLRDDYLARFSKEIRPLRTTAHVIAEIQGLAETRVGLYSQDLCSFWRHSFDFLLGKDLDESLVRLIELRELNRIVCEIGVIDTALIHLTHKEGGILLSTDRRLIGRAREQSVAVISEFEFACGVPLADGASNHPHG